MRVAIVLNTAWNIYNFRLGLARRLLAEGHEVVAIAPPDDYVDAVKEVGCTFIPLQHLSRKGTNPFGDLLLTRELRKIYKEEQIDVALLYTIKPIIYGTLAANKQITKTLATVTGLGYAFMNSGFVNSVAKRLYSFVFQRSTQIFFQNRDDLQLFLNLGLNFPDNYKIVPGSGIDTDYFSPEFNEDREDNEFHFLLVSRLLYDKGIREFQEAVELIEKELPNARYIMVGTIDKENPAVIEEEPFREWLEQHPNVSYMGGTDDVRSYIARADALLLPSYREGLPRVMLEGMAMAKPLIATDVPGCRDTINQGINGYLVKVKDGPELGAAMKKMALLSPEERKRMGQAGRKMALEIFDEKIIVQHYVDALAAMEGTRVASSSKHS